MADISKCKGTDCPIRDSCYRYTAPDSLVWQSYYNYSYDHEKEECKDFWKRRKI